MAVIKDVARLAGVSTGTVSKYLNNPHKLKEDTRLKVESAIKELQYKPSPLARSMRTGRTNTLAVLVPDVINPFFAEVYNSLRIASASKGYTAILYTTQDDLNTLKDYITGMSLHQVDGIVLCFLDEDEAVESFLEDLQNETPVVQISWDIYQSKFNSVVIDVIEGTLDATNHLTALGHKKIAYIGGPNNNKISKEKFNGYSKALSHAGITIDNDIISHCSFSMREGYQSARKLFSLDHLPTAVVAENDILALGCMKFFLQKGIRVPDDVAITGFDNISLSSIYEPALTTVSIPIDRLGLEAINLFINKLNNPAARNRQIILNTELIVRSSTDKNSPVTFEI